MRPTNWQAVSSSSARASLIDRLVPRLHEWHGGGEGAKRSVQVTFGPHGDGPVRARVQATHSGVPEPRIIEALAKVLTRRSKGTATESADWRILFADLWRDGVVLEPKAEVDAILELEDIMREVEDWLTRP